MSIYALPTFFLGENSLKITVSIYIGILSRTLKSNFDRIGQTGKMFFIAAITSMIAVVLMLLTGVISVSDLIELDRKMIEFCPFCMAA